MPYRVELLTYGGLGATTVRPTKMYPDRGGECLTPDELAVWEYVTWLEGERARCAAEVRACAEKVRAISRHVGESEARAMTARVLALAADVVERRIEASMLEAGIDPNEIAAPKPKGKK